MKEFPSFSFWKEAKRFQETSSTQALNRILRYLRGHLIDHILSFFCKESYCYYLKVIREQWDVRVFGGWYFSYLHYLSCNKASKHLVLCSISWIWQGMRIWALFWPDNCVTLPLTSFYTAFRSRPKPNLNNKQQERILRIFFKRILDTFFLPWFFLSNSERRGFSFPQLHVLRANLSAWESFSQIQRWWNI